MLTPAEAVELLCRATPRWRRRLPGIVEDGLPYPAIAELGHELISMVLAGRARPVRRLFQAIERCLVDGDPDARNLLLAGMFEAMQNDAYARMDPPDELNRWLGPVSLQAWADLIEGWTGAGIRTIEHWRRVIINGSIMRIHWQSRDGDWTLERGETGTTLDHSINNSHERTSRMLAPAEAAAILKNFQPLVAERLIDPGTADLTYATLHVEQPHQRVHVQIGGVLGAGRVASDGDRWFVLDSDAIAAIVAQ